MKIRVAKIIVVLSAVLAFGFIAAGCGHDSAEGVEAVSDETVEDETDETSTAQTENTPTEENTGQTVDFGTGAVRSDAGRWHVLAPDVAAVVDADFEGVVWKTDSDSFYIVESTTEILEDGSITGSSLSPSATIPDSELIQVVFDEDTYFYIRSIYDGGARYEDEAAGFADLEKGVSVEMKGEFVNDVFHADKVRIIRVF